MTLTALIAALAPTPRGIAEEPVSIRETNPDNDADRSAETILINGEYYTICQPWIGQKVNAPPLAFESFKRIPATFTYNGTHIYVHKDCFASLLEMLYKAQKDGIVLLVESGYRSLNYQRMIFTRMLEQGRTFDDIIRYVAPPGYSQHALGTAVDFYPSNWRFADTPAYHWLKENADNFSFEESYSQDNPRQIPWEAWHWNYIGK